MGGHFSLDVDVEQLRRAKRGLVHAAGHLAGRATSVRKAPRDWATDWTGRASEHMAAQARDLAKDAAEFSDDFGAAASGLKRFITVAAQAEDVTVPDLNRRWREATLAHTAAVERAQTRHDSGVDALPKDATPQARKEQRRTLDEAREARLSDASSALSLARQGLEAEYDELVADLKAAARRLGSDLQHAVAMAVPAKLAGQFTTRTGDGNPLTGLLRAGGRTWLETWAANKFGGPALDLLQSLDNPSNDLDDVAARLAEARELGLDPADYAETLEQYWFLKAAQEAGVDVDTWKPELGAEHNRETIMAIYRYYGDLYLANSDLQWAGMANMIGPSFAGGFLDLSMLRDLAQYIEKFPPGARPFDAAAISALAGLTDADLSFYETTLLGMQKEIFHDMGTMHEAYRTGGIDAIRELYDAGVIDGATFESWQGIDSGDPERVAAGNEQFLRREQEEIIDDDYQRMYNHPVTGQIVTWGMTQIGAPSIPGAQTYARIDPLNVAIPTPGTEHVFQVPFTDVGWLDNPLQGDVRVDTPFADGNVALFKDRWRLIEEDTLPAYQALLSDDPDLVRALVSADVATRVEEYRLASTWDDILTDFLTDWEVTGFEQ